MSKNQASNATILAGHIDARRSGAAISASAIGIEVVERLLAAASRAPSAHNRQPWRFVALNSMDSSMRLPRRWAANCGGPRCRRRRPRHHRSRYRALLSTHHAGATRDRRLCRHARDGSVPRRRPQRGGISDGRAKHGHGGAEPAACGGGGEPGASIMSRSLFCPDIVAGV